MQPAEAGQAKERRSKTKVTPKTASGKLPGDLAWLIPLVEALGARLLPRAPAPTMGTRARGSNSTAPSTAAGLRSVIVANKDRNGKGHRCSPSLKDRSHQEEHLVPVVSHQWLCDCAASFQVLPAEQYTLSMS